MSAISKSLASLLVCFALTGCAGQSVNPVPVPPDTRNAPEPADGKEKEGAFTPYDASYQENASGPYLAVEVPQRPVAGPRKGDPAELAALLEMKGSTSKEKNAVMLMRPSAIREAAQLVTLQTAIAWRYKQLVDATEHYSPVMDTAFNFSPLIMTQGQALIMPPLLTRAGASMRIEDAETATTADTTYEMLAPARYISTIPNWREYLMMEAFPEPEKPNPALLPQNNEERAIWREAVREAWAHGLAEAEQLYADNVARMVREYRGIMLYHLLTAQHLLSRIDTASASLGMHTTDSGDKLNIGQKVYRITAPSRFITKGK